MKKLFCFLALMGCMVACNENKPAGGKGEKEAFVIKVQDVTSTMAYISIIPEDEDRSYYWGWMSAIEALELGNLTKAVQMELEELVKETGYEYEDMLREEILRIGALKWDLWDEFNPNTDYVVFAVYVNEELKVEGDVVTYEFTTLDGEEEPTEEEFIDLSLPSGTKWAIQPIRRTDDEWKEFTLSRAKGDFPGQVPTKSQWNELMKKCIVQAQIGEDGEESGIWFINEEIEKRLFVPTPRSIEGEEGTYYVGDYLTTESGSDYVDVAHLEADGEEMVSFSSIDILGEAYLILVDESKEVEEEETPEGYVDLDLPSGTLWATVPEYNSMNEHGLFSFEFATALGYTGHIPSRFQWDELLEYTEYSITTVDGVNGCKLVSKENGNELFIPIQGFVDESGNYRSDWGSYMSSTLFENEFYDRMLYSFDFNASNSVPSADNETDVRYQLSLLKVFETITREEDGK